MAKKFELIDKPTGYVTKPDKTNTSPSSLVAGSQNVLINDAEKITGRGGYTLFGVANSALTPIVSSHEWQTSTGNELPLRSYDDELEVYIGTAEGRTFNSWEKLKDAWATVDFVFTTWWNTTEKIDLLLFVAGDANIYEWSGAKTTFASATATTITKEGTGTWGASRFLIGGARQIRIKDSGGTWRTFTYTGGESTTTLTGVTVDPTTFTFTAGALVLQEVRTNANKPASGSVNDGIATLKNQVYIGSLTSREVNVSKNTDFTLFTFSSPRAPGEGALLTLDNTWTAFAPQEEDMYISAGKDDWYKTSFTLSDTITSEAFKVEKLKTAPRQAAQTHDLTAKIKNSVVFISNEPTLDELGRLENINTPQSQPLSDPIKPDFDAADFTNGHVKYFGNKVYICCPANGTVFIRDLDKGFWQPPQKLPIRRFAIIGGELYGHSSLVPETYKLFTGVDDNDNYIDFRIFFAYRNFGDRAHNKAFDEYFTEGYISPNTTLTMGILYDFQGASGSAEFIIDGNSTAILFGSGVDNSLGKESFGKEPLGSSMNENAGTLPKFRHIATFRPTDNYEYQVSYKTTDPDAQFELLAQGPNPKLATVDNVFIKK